MYRRVIQWLANRTLREYILFIFWLIMSILITLIAIAWSTGINNQFYGLLVNASTSGAEGYTSTFEEDLKEFAFAIKDYGTVALSFFGITFLGGIFDLRRDNSEEGLLSRYATLIIFGISIMFLMSFVILYFFYSLVYPYITTTGVGIILLLNAGLGLFIASVDLLLFILLIYFVRISFLSRRRITKL